MAIVIEAVACGCKHERTPAAAPQPVPKVDTRIKIDGEWDEHDWSARALRGQFVGKDGGLSRPSSEVRFLRDDQDLFVGLYAADDNILSTDAFELDLAGRVLRIDATGKVTPELSGVRVAVDRDGTLDNPSNFDEEWLIELAIPLASVNLDRDGHAGVTASRCDTPKHGPESCGTWSGTIELRTDPRRHPFATIVPRHTRGSPCDTLLYCRC